MADFETIVLERDMDCSPARLFHAMTDRELRQIWSAPSDAHKVVIDEFDCRAGGREVTRCGPKEAPEFGTVGTFHVVGPDLIVFSEVLEAGGQVLSVSLCSQEISARGAGSHLKVTLQISSLAGPELFDDYKGGWAGALDSLVKLTDAAA